MCINRNGTTMSKLEQQDPNENSRKIFDGYDTTDKENSIKRDPENEKKENNERHEETTHPQPTPIAICGMSLRLPGNLRTPSDLFSFLLNHHDARASPDHVRYNANTHGHSKSPQSSEGYFLRHADLAGFDPSLFSMTEAEIANLDPQQRLLLQIVWEAFDCAGETKFRGSNTGCFVGTFGDDWKELQGKDVVDNGLYRLTGCMPFAHANRISYEFDLGGPSMTIRSACSASGLALHLACQSIRNGECEAAIVGGVNLIFSPGFNTLMSEQGVLAPDASCKTFDAGANGYARAEAVNCLYIKRLDTAIKDGNPVRAVIRGSATNSNGKMNGLTAPSLEAQIKLIRKAYQAAGIPENEIEKTAVVECHGTGTAAGDAVEVGALANVFGDKGVYITSIKPNLGHSEAASGITSVIKSVLALENRTILPNIKFKIPNPKIPWKSAHLTVPTEPLPWPNDRLERISVNNFGIGGTNVTIILDSAASQGLPRLQIVNAPPPTPGDPGAPGKPTLLLFSAGHQESLKKIVKNHNSYHRNYPDKLDDLAYNLTHRRVHLPLRTYSIVDENRKLRSSGSPVFKSGAKTKTTFVFTGQGAQWPRMGAELLQFPEVLQDVRKMDDVLHNLPHSPVWHIEDCLSETEGSSRLNEAAFSQPICTALQIALVNHLRRHGIKPVAVVGHSSGEIAAAYTAGALSLEEAIIVAYYRGYIVQQSVSLTRRGSMAAVGLGRDQVTPFLVPGVTVACENSNASTTLSGDISALEILVSNIRQSNPETFVRTLKIDMAYHSDHMTEIGSDYELLIQQFIQPKPPKIPFFSSVTPKILEHASDFSASYWRRNLENPVLFQQAVKKLLTYSADIYVEIGPHSALAGPLKQIFAETSIVPDYISVLNRNVNSTTSWLTALGELHCRGAAVAFPIPPGREPHVLVDLPPYPWNLEKSYWPKSRVIHAWQHRAFPPHELLGTRTLESSNATPSWRCLLNVDNVLWLRDHCIGREIVFPAAGFIAMAGEMIRQINDGKLKGFSLRDFDIMSALVLPVAQGQNVELFSHVRRQMLNNTEEGEWWEFEVQSCADNNNVWTKHCKGLIKAGQASRAPKIPVDDESFLRSVDSAKLYKAMARVGYHYGTAFRGMKDIRASVNLPGATFRVADVQEHDEGVVAAYFLHPTTIDQVLQSLLVARHQGQLRLMEKLYLPTHIEEIFVSNSTSGRRLQFQTTFKKRYGIGLGDSIGKLDNQSPEPCFFMKGARFSPVDDEIADSDTHGATQLVWKPDLDLVDSTALLRPVENPDFRKTQEALEHLFVLCALDVQETFTNDPGSIMDIRQPHLVNHRSWIDTFLEQVQDPKANFMGDNHRKIELLGSSKTTREESIRKIVMDCQRMGKGAVVAASLILRCRDAAQSLFTGQTNPLDLFLDGGALHELYDFMNGLWSYKYFLQLLVHQRGRHLKILEIGAGTGGLTARILADLALASGDGDICAQYTFTDVSAGFFAAAKERFQKYSGLKFRVLDISRDPVDQGFEKGEWDLVVASNVLHATPDLTQTLRNVHQLLKPDGRLLLQELTSESKWINFIMGFLPGWWLGQADNRAYEPYISIDEWDTRLGLAGFSGIESVVYDAENPYQLNSSVIARPDASKVENSSKHITLLSELRPGIRDESVMAKDLEVQLIANGYSVTHLRWDPKVSLPAEGDVISLLDFTADSGFFAGLTKDNLKQFQSLMQHFQDSPSSRVLLWLTPSCQIGPKDAQYAQVLGVARTIRIELEVAFATLELDMVNESAMGTVCKVLNKIRHERSRSDTLPGPDMEFALVDGQVYIPRCRWLSVPNTLATVSDTPETVQNKAEALHIARPGALQTLRWVSRDLQPLEPGMVRVDVRAAGLNFKDVVNAMGIIPSSSTDDTQGSFLGLEAAGVVIAAGSAITHVQPGDRVMLFAPQAGCFATQVQISGKLCVRIPRSLSFVDAAGMPCVFITVLHALVKKAGLKKGQKILIHSAAGGVGLAAIQVASLIGAEIFATVGNEEKAAFLCREWDLKKENIFCSREEGFLDGVLAMTGGIGIDVVLNSLSGSMLHASWKCVAPEGCFVELGKRDTLGHGKLAMEMFDENRAFMGVEMANLAVQNPDAVSNLLHNVLDLYVAGSIKPVKPVNVFDCKEIGDAFRFLQSGTHIGKVIIDFGSENVTLPTVPTTPPAAFDPTSAYILIGGLGGLGTSIARWMANHGARNLFFLSRRSNINSPILAELQAMGCSAKALVCDISNQRAVQSTMTTISTTHRIAGAIHLAMVLSDAAVSKMTLRNWQSVTDPKVQGTYNLHRSLPPDLDFFVLFASMNGLTGYWGQANYAAANSFLDAFAQWRQAQGLPCSVLDLGGVEDVGYVSEKRGVEDAMRAAGNRLVSERALFEGLQLAIALSKPQGKRYRIGPEDGIFCTGQLGLGFNCTLPLSDPRNSVAWKNDARMVFYNSTAGESLNTANTGVPGSRGGELVDELMESIRACPAKLDEPGCSRVLARITATQMNKFLMRDDADAAISTEISLTAYGMDSLLAIEMKNWWRKTFGVTVSTLQLLSKKNFEDLGELALGQLREKMHAGSLSKK